MKAWMFVGVLLAAVLAGCGEGSRARAYEEARQDTSVNPPSRQQVVERLYGEGLIMDKEVQQAAAEYMNEAQEGKKSAAEASLRLLDWLEEWEEENPERAQAARAAMAVERGERPSPPAGAKKESRWGFPPFLGNR